MNNSEMNIKSNNVISKIMLIILALVTIYVGLIAFNIVDGPFSLFAKKESISFSVERIELRKGQITHLDVTNESGDAILYTSSDPNIVSVNEVTGFVEAIKPGTATITVQSRKNSNIKDECVIDVVNTVSSISVESIKLDTESLSLSVGDSRTLHFTISPSNADLKKIIWSSSDNKVVSVDKYGVVKAIGVGNATIRIKTDNEKEATCMVSVTKKSTSGGKKTQQPKEIDEEIEVTSISFESNNVNLNIGKSYNLKSRMTIKPDNATNKKITWTSSNSSVATVNDGVVTGIKAGTVTVTAKSNSGKTATCTFAVKTSGSTKDNNAIASDGTINNKYFNIVEGSGVNRNTAIANTKGINEAITYANKNGIKNIKLKKSTYVVANVINSSEGILNSAIQLKSNINFNLNGSTIKMHPNSDAQYSVILIYNVKNIKVYNGTLEGDRAKHTCGNGKTLIISEDKRVGPDARKNKKCNDGSKGDGTHEWGMGIRIRNSSSVEIYGLTIKEMTGDGVAVGNTRDGVPLTTKNITIRNNNIYNCRRQGITVARVDGLKINNNSIHNIKGTNPQAGIDVEPDTTKNFIIKAEIISNKFSNNGSDFSSYNKLTRCTTKEEVSIIIRGNDFDCNNSHNVYLRESLRKSFTLSGNTCSKIHYTGQDYVSCK